METERFLVIETGEKIPGNCKVLLDTVTGEKYLSVSDGSCVCISPLEEGLGPQGPRTE